MFNVFSSYRSPYQLLATALEEGSCLECNGTGVLENKAFCPKCVGTGFKSSISTIREMLEIFEH